MLTKLKMLSLQKMYCHPSYLNKNYNHGEYLRSRQISVNELISGDKIGWTTLDKNQSIIGYSVRSCECEREPTFFEFIKSKITGIPFQSEIIKAKAVFTLEIPSGATVIRQDAPAICEDDPYIPSRIMSTDKWIIKDITPRLSDDYYKVYKYPLKIKTPDDLSINIRMKSLDFVCDKEFAEKRWNKSSSDPSTYQNWFYLLWHASKL